MNKITRLVKGKAREKRVNVYLDGRFAFSLLVEVAIKRGLKIGQELSESEIEGLLGTDRHQRCYNAAARYLGYRPRSEKEVRLRLQRHGFDEECVDWTLGKLKERGLVDDTAFAQFWIENRESFSPRSRRLTRVELQRKGLDSGIIDQTITEVDDNDSAYRAAASKANRLSSTDFNTFRRRLGEHLRRRGFSYEVINEITQRVWREQSSSPAKG